jgi:hypothetical protein
MDRQSQESVFAVVEGDAACPFWMNHWGTAPKDDWSMLEQEAGECRRDFSARLSDSLVRLGAETGSNDVVLLVVGHRTDEEAVAARWDLATTVLTHLAQHGGGRLLFTRGHGSDARAEASLTALAQELAQEWAWSGIEIGTRLHEVPRVSQVRRSSAPPYVYRPDAFAQAV